MIAYGSIYGNTENAANILACRLADRGVKNIVMYDALHASVHHHLRGLPAAATSYSASATYNGGIFQLYGAPAPRFKRLTICRTAPWHSWKMVPGVTADVRWEKLS